MHLVGFFIRIYRDARSHERQTPSPLGCDIIWVGKYFVKFRRRIEPPLRLPEILGSARSRSQWSLCLQRRSAAARLLGLWCSNPAGRVDVCCVLSGRGVCGGVITRPEESYRLWCIWV